MSYGVVSVWVALLALIVYVIAALDGRTNDLSGPGYIAVSPLGRFSARAAMQRTVILMLLGGVVGAPLLSGVSLLSVIRGPIPETSLLTFLLSTGYLAQTVMFGRAGACLSLETKRLVIGLAAVSGVLYATTLQDLGVDVYAWGYLRGALWLFLLVLSAIFWFLGQKTTAAWLLTATLAWRMSLLESDNLWDYMVDPLLAVTGLVFALKSLRSRRVWAART